MRIRRLPDGTAEITLSIGEQAIIRGASIDVQLEQASNNYNSPGDTTDRDEVSITGVRRSIDEYPDTGKGVIGV